MLLKLINFFATVSGNELRLMFVGVIGSTKHIEVHNDRLIVQLSPVMHELDGALRVTHHAATSLAKRPHPLRLAIVSRRREELPRCQALDNEPHGS